MSDAVLITGSRNATPEMLAQAYELVRWMAKHEHVCLVGDAMGVDAAVRKACHELEVMVFVYGAYNTIRGPSYPDEQPTTVDGTYLDRDKVMASHADRCFALHNRASATHGTQATYRYARARIGEKARIKEFS